MHVCIYVALKDFCVYVTLQVATDDVMSQFMVAIHTLFEHKCDLSSKNQHSLHI